MGIQDKSTKNNIKSKNCLKRKHCGSSKNFTLIDWYIVIKPSVPCSGWKRISEKMSVYSDFSKLGCLWELIIGDTCCIVFGMGNKHS